MKKYEKEILQAFLGNEDEVIKQLKATYEQALKDIDEKIKVFMSRPDANMQYVIYQVEYQKALQKQISGILDELQANEFETISEYLLKSYEEGFVSSMYSLQKQGIPLCFSIDQNAVANAVQLDSKISNGLYSAVGEDVAALKKNIAAEVSRGISNGSSYHQIARQIRHRMVGAYTTKTGGALYRAELISRTEGHRIQNQSAMDACYKAKEKGADIVRQWDSTLDGRTRPSHQAVDGEIRELDEPFSNDLMFPGDPSGGAAEVVNCRCALLQRARWALDDDELDTLKKRAEYFGLDKSKNFDDFKKKYIEISKIADYNNSRKKIDLQFFANRSIAKQSDRQILKSISSWKENISEHEDKIKNPAKYDRDWDSKTEVQKAGLIRHWEKEVRHFDDNIKEAEAELAKRLGAQQNE